MHRLAGILLLLSILICSCSSQEKAERVETRPALADTLVSVFEQLKQAALVNQSGSFLDMLDTVSAKQFQAKASRIGFSSLRTYVEHQFQNWPDPDTMSFVDLVAESDYARLSLQGSAGRFGSRRDRIRWTFLLFHKEADSWRLSAVSSMEKGRFDRYGTKLSYFETELPPRLRFPRAF